jgi:ribose-phosphate pyrophosphokinase
MVELYAYNRSFCEKVDVNFWNFPAGERGVKIVQPETCTNRTKFRLRVNFSSSDDLIDMMLLVDAIRNIENSKIELYIPYFPYARQDRVMQEGESHSLRVVANLIKSCNFSKIWVDDPHSDVLAGMFGSGDLEITEQYIYAKELLGGYAKNPNTYLVSPDAGALKKIYKVAKHLELPVIEANKVRDVSTGNIIRTKVDTLDTGEQVTLIVVDDIIDGGKTYIELAKVLKETYAIRELVLFATHGIFSKGVDVLACYDKIYVHNNMSEFNLTQFNTR